MAAKTSSPSPVEQSAVEKYPDFTKNILELLGKLPADNFLEFLLSIFGNCSYPREFEEEVVDAMRYLETPAPEKVVDFLFDGVEGQEFCDDTYSGAIATLALIADKEDKPRLVQAIISYLGDKLENEGHQEIMGVLQGLTSELK